MKNQTPNFKNMSVAEISQHFRNESFLTRSVHAVHNSVSTQSEPSQTEVVINKLTPSSKSKMKM